MRGKLIVFEGIDGVGKSTQIQRLRAKMEAAGRTVVQSREPTDGPYGARLRRSMAEGRLSPDEELSLFIDDRRDHVARLIEPSLAGGHDVLLDRYYFSTVAYQGVRGHDPEALLALNESFAPAPDLLLVLDLDPALGLERIHARSGQPRDTFEVPELLAASRRLFIELAARKPYARLLDASVGVEALAEQVWSHVQALLAD